MSNKQDKLIIDSKYDSIGVYQLGENFAVISWNESWVWVEYQSILCDLRSMRVWYWADRTWWQHITKIERIYNSELGAKKYADELHSKWLPVVVIWRKWVVYYLSKKNGKYPK